MVPPNTESERASTHTQSDRVDRNPALEEAEVCVSLYASRLEFSYMGV